MSTTRRDASTSTVPSVAAVALLVSAVAAVPAFSQPLDPDAIEQRLELAAAWQIEGRAGFLHTDWTIAPFWDGLLAAATATGDAGYAGEALGFGESISFALGSRFYHADDHAVGHAWLDLFLADPSRAERLAPTQQRMDAILANPETRDLAFGRPGPAMDRWTWCDALYMAPATWARLHTATGSTTYLDFTLQEWTYTHDTLGLWSPVHGFYFRDNRFLDRTASNGEPMFWSRGNGWVFSGIPLTLEHTPADHPLRDFLVPIYLRMAEAVLDAQQPDGFWRPNLLDPNDPASRESSGTAFYTFGLAWGVNNGLLDEADVWPAVERGWRALETCQQPGGLVGWVQPPDEGPNPAGEFNTAHYGTGAFLLAGSEIIRGLDPTRGTTLAALIDDAERYVDSYWNITAGITGATILDHSGNDGNVPENVFDGITDDGGNRWSVFGIDQPRFLEADLGSLRQIRGVVLHPYQSRDYQYTVEFATDLQGGIIPNGSPDPRPGIWTLVVDRRDNTEFGPKTDLFDTPIAARYVRLTVTGAATYPGDWVSVQELELLPADSDVDFVPPPPDATALRPWPLGCGPADLTADGTIDVFDIVRFFQMFADAQSGGGDIRSVDWIPDDAADIFDIIRYLTVAAQGCG